MTELKMEDGVMVSGVVGKCWSTRNEVGEVVKMDMEIDLSGITIEELVAKSVSNLVITRQGQERKCTKELLEGISGTRIHYSDMGKKIIDPEQAKIDTLRKAKTMSKDEREALIATLLEMNYDS